MDKNVSKSHEANLKNSKFLEAKIFEDFKIQISKEFSNINDNFTQSKKISEDIIESLKNRTSFKDLKVLEDVVLSKVEELKISSSKKFADHLEQMVINTGHVSLKKNVLAALAITFKEVTCEEYDDYSQQVLDNARALEDGLKKSGVELLCSPTENHLVLVELPTNQNGEEISNKLMQADLLVKAETLMTADENIKYPILRLSSLDPTTRSLGEDDMFTVGLTLGEFLKSSQDTKAISSVRKIIKDMVENLPLFSEEWLPESEIVHKNNTELMMKALIYGI